ncbi:GNAT family N-acetyltransferase [Arenicella sp. 4NH20-0111]|uniref:GNAT family N-acetyltransferase n=1 Tax=Arenicella sp. 4NH20-0111 TaxID=3127648 RepID=UPI003109276A
MDPINTARLTLRQWESADILPFYEMCSDPEVMRFFPSTLTLGEVESAITRFSDHIERNQFGFWAAQRTESGEFIGFVGLKFVDDGFDFSPNVEIGWRLSKSSWGQGLATEAALESLKFGFENRQLNEIVSMTPALNAPSERVMQRIGMIGSPKKFAHPKLPLNHVLSEHVLYRLSRRDWLNQRKKGEV